MVLTYWFETRDTEEEFEYEVDLNVLYDAVVEYYSVKYGFPSVECRSLISELYYNDMLNYENDWDFEDYLKEVCYEDAYHQFKEEQEGW